MGPKAPFWSKKSKDSQFLFAVRRGSLTPADGLSFYTKISVSLYLKTFFSLFGAIRAETLDITGLTRSPDLRGSAFWCSAKAPFLHQIAESVGGALTIWCNFVTLNVERGSTHGQAGTPGEGLGVADAII